MSDNVSPERNFSSSLNKKFLVSRKGIADVVFRPTGIADSAVLTFPHMILRGQEMTSSALDTLGGLSAVALLFHV